jgi:hypothetical protein
MRLKAQPRRLEFCANGEDVDNPKGSIVVHFRFLAYPIFSKSSYDFDLASIDPSSIQACSLAASVACGAFPQSGMLEPSQFRTIHLYLQSPTNEHPRVLRVLAALTAVWIIGFPEAVCLRLQNAKEEDGA